MWRKTIGGVNVTIQQLMQESRRWCWRFRAHIIHLLVAPRDFLHVFQEPLPATKVLIGRQSGKVKISICVPTFIVGPFCDHFTSQVVDDSPPVPSCCRWAFGKSSHPRSKVIFPVPKHATSIPHITQVAVGRRI